MKVAFRTDASLDIGSGHVMRCLTLAEALRARGAQCHFVAREHPGHMNEVIRQRGFTVASLLPGTSGPLDDAEGPAHQTNAPAHAPWLGCDWQADAGQTKTILSILQPDLLVVDHYALDHGWEAALRPHCQKLLVIDDLADRQHNCDLLLDQNLGRQPRDYAALVSAQCEVMAGPQYALLRPEFAALRPYSLQRHQSQPTLRHLLVTMGGVDRPNATAQVLQSLRSCDLPRECRISVVMGPGAPWLDQVSEFAGQMPWPTEVAAGIGDMAQRMVASDLAIGAAGGTSWERCCLGLPTLLVVLADNQWPGARAMAEAGAASLVGSMNDIATQLPPTLHESARDCRLVRLGTAAAKVTDGRGVDRVLRVLGCGNE